MRALVGRSERFEFVRDLGAGGMGVVLEAVDCERNLRVALKGLRKLQANSVLRFKNEFRALRDVQHPNLVQLGELFELEGSWFFTMELLDGQDFLAYIRCAPPGSEPTVASQSVAPTATGRTLPDEPPVAHDSFVTADVRDDAGVNRATSHVPHTPSTERGFDEVRLRDALAQLTIGLSALHAAGKVHRDVKPSNIVIERDGRVVLVDFGIVAEAQQRKRNELVGTVPYMAPEQSEGAITQAADWYAVGCVLFQTLTGALPFPGGVPELQLANKRTFDAPSPDAFVAGLPRDLVELCSKLLARNPADRPDGAAILRALGAEPMVDATGHNETADLVYIGREAEFGALWSVYRDTELTGVRSVVVEGTSGVGKSALVEQFVRQLRVAAHDVVVFSGRCHERESVPYKAFDAMIDELGRWLQTLDNERFSALVPDTIDVLFQVFPALRTIEDRPAEAAPMAGPMTLTTESRRRAFDTLAEVLCRIARWRPLVLVTDDIHWADPDSVALLRHLVRKTSQASFMLLATARDEGTTLPDVFNALGDTARRIPLGPLSPTETQQLAASLFELRSARPDLDLAAVTRESHGHPMFVRELVAYANRTGRASANLDDALWTRASELDASSLALLELVAVAGTPMAQGVIATAAGLEPPAYARSIGHLRSRHLVRQRGARNRDTIEPYHDRVREALYTRIDQIRRVQLHGQLAAALEQLGGGADPLADHLEKAEQPAKAAEYALRAARAAARALAFERAVSRYRQALRLAGPNANGRAQMLIEFGDVAIDAGRADEAAEAFIEASNDESLEPDVRRDLRRRVAEQFLMGGNLERGLSEMQTMLSEVGLRLPRSRASLVARLLWHQWRIGRHSLAWEPCSEDSLSAQQLTRLDTYWSVGAGTGVVDSPLSALFMTQGARECLAVGEPFRLARSLTSASISEMAAGRPKQAERMLDAATRAAEAADSDMARSYVLYAQAMKHHMVEGDWPACGAAADEALALWRKAGRGRGWEWDTLHLFKCWSLHFMQRLADLRAYCDPLIASAVATGNRFQEVNIRLFAFMSLVADDEPDAALAYVDDAMSRWIPVSEVFSNQAYYALRARSYVAVYSNTEGDPSRVMNNEWRRFDRTLMGQVAVIRAEAHMLRAQESLGSAASAAARQDQRQMRRHMRRAAHHIRSLRKVNNGVSDIAAPLLEAGLEHLRGNADGVVAILREALPLFESRRMVCYTGSARRRLGALIGGDEGSALVASADATYADQGILNPAKMTRTCCPGWPEDFT